MKNKSFDTIKCDLPGLKTARDSENEYGFLTYFGLKLGQHLENRVAQPHQKFRGGQFTKGR